MSMEDASKSVCHETCAWKSSGWYSFWPFVKRAVAIPLFPVLVFLRKVRHGSEANQRIGGESVKHWNQGNRTGVLALLLGLIWGGYLGGELWAAGETMQVSWEALGLVGGVKAVLKRGAGTVGEIGRARASDGGFLWRIPANLEAREDYRIKVQSVVNLGLRDTGGAFRILGARTLTVVRPNGGQIWSAGSTRRIRWNAQNVPGDVDLLLRKLDGSGSVVLGRAQAALPRTFQCSSNNASHRATVAPCSAASRP